MLDRKAVHTHVRKHCPECESDMAAILDTQGGEDPDPQGLGPVILAVWECLGVMRHHFTSSVYLGHSVAVVLMASVFMGAGLT